LHIRLKKKQIRKQIEWGNNFGWTNCGKKIWTNFGREDKLWHGGLTLAQRANFGTKFLVIEGTNFCKNG
jgi:hypothetical protein